MRFFLTLAALVFLSPSLVFAQDTAQKSEKLMGDPTPRQLKEASAFLNQCNLNEAMNTRHNCKCLALQFLEKRVQKGDEVKANILLAELRNSCLLESAEAMKELGYEDLQDIPREVFDEAELINQQCQQDTLMRVRHDCDCIAGRFIDDRIKAGPSVDAMTILSNYQGLCKNTVGLAGYTYKSCMEQKELMVPDNLKPKYYCECYASTYAKAYGDLIDKPTSYTESALIGKASSECKNKLSKDEKYQR